LKKKELINDTNGHKIKDSFVIVSVKDNGTGIDEEILPKLITKFASKSHVGTGLGLYLSKNIIDHGDKIWGGNNKDSKDATFSFSIPLT
jgi:signal transduction histidine kinase